MATRKEFVKERSISFKSAGEKIEAFQARNSLAERPPREPIGIRTPLQLGTDRLFRMNYNIQDQIKDNFRNLILTQKGERLGNPEFGTRLRKIQYSSGDPEETEIAMMSTIKSAASKYMPFIALQDFSVDQQEDTTGGSTGILILRVTYSVPQIGPEIVGIRLVFPMGV